MSEAIEGQPHETDRAPGDRRLADWEGHLRGYLLGLGLAVALTGASFAVCRSVLIYAPAVPAALIVLGIAQMGVHLVFFLHITTSPDNVNNTMALAFGVLIVLLLIGGSIWIMSHLDHALMPISRLMEMQR